MLATLTNLNVKTVFFYLFSGARKHTILSDETMATYLAQVPDCLNAVCCERVAGVRQFRIVNPAADVGVTLA